MASGPRAPRAKAALVRADPAQRAVQDRPRCWNVGVVASGERLRVDVLGPIRAIDAAGVDVTPDGNLQRRLLALLVLRRGHIVTVDAAVDVLWPTKPPRDPVSALHTHLFRLRRGLPEGLIQSTAEGYRLDPGLLDVDAERLAAAVRDGASADPAVLAQVDAILERWHGPAYPELDDVDDGYTEAVRLGELRTRAREVWAERRLASGDTDGLVAALAALADAEPLRERPRALLMAALAAAGRQVEALRVYDDFRRLLGDELGIEPSPALVAQHAGLLVGGDGGVAVDGRAAWAPASRLPVPATSLVGRDALVAEVSAMVEDHRLTTLVGPGGVGKTRLLIEVGHRLRAARPDRPVVMCELATAGPESAVNVVAAALGIDARAGVDLGERVAAVLADTQLALLLDNCEHVLEPVANLTDRLLGMCANVTVVATSRERLRLPGERLCVVPTLLAEAGTDHGPAVELFVERARAVAAGFEPSDGDRACIDEIVRRLDGLPLAIELAAARLHTHDLPEVAAGLDRRFALLSSGYRTSARHGSLHAAVSWSVGLLDAELQATFADLSVFAGSFTAADAAAVCGVDPAAAAAALAQLAERSLVMRAPGRRYVLLETLRAFGAEQLAATGRAHSVGERHARHQVDWVEQADRRLLEPGQPVLAEIDAALPELRLALGWLLDHDRPDLAGRLVTALLDFGLLRLRPDVLAWSERVTAADPGDAIAASARVWVVAAYAAWMAGDAVGTGVRAARALRLAERRGGAMPPEVLTINGNQALFEGRLAEAVGWYRRAADASADDPAQHQLVSATELLALGYAGDEGAPARAAALLDAFGNVSTGHAAYLWYCAGEADMAVDVERARARFARALHLAEETGASFVTGVAGASKASIDARLGDPVAAAADYRGLIAHWRRAGMWSTQWTMLRAIAVLLDRLGRPRDAAVLEGAVRATGAGHRIFGADEVVLAELGARLCAALGEEAYDAALREGARLDGDAAVEHALRSL
jgi:predicted ATPase/DNA-binding SARP family transcriptional activator